MKAGVRAVSSNKVAGQATPETESATPVKAWESTNVRYFQPHPFELIIK